VFSAAELIEVLHARFRRRFPLQADRPLGGFPPTWRVWLLSLQEQRGTVTGAPVGEYISAFAGRPLRPLPKASAELSRLRAFASLMRQQWEPAPRDQRGIRRFAALFSGLLHLVFAVMLLWLGFVAIGDAPPQTRQAGDAVQVEFIGTGTPVEVGGAQAPGQVDAPASGGAAAPAQASAAAVPTPPPPLSQPSVPDTASDTPPQTVEVPPAQSLVVTETTQPDIDFTLPAPVPRELALPQMRTTTPELASEVVEVEKTFEPRSSVRVLEQPTPRLPTPTAPALRTEVTEIEVYRPLPQVQARELSQTAVRRPDLLVPEIRATPGEVQVRTRPAAAAATASGQATTPPAATTGTAASTGRGTGAVAAPTAGGRPQAQGTGPTANTAPTGAGPTPSPRPGATPSTVRSDDWGDSNRNVPGNSAGGRTSGLFNSDGSVRLPGDGGRVGGGLPPGTITEDFEKIDRMGTWLKRPPLDYTPTRFDRFWVPHENLLQEWVRRGVKEVLIPIPGTSKKMRCVVSLLQAAGGCSITDPNLQDQEAIARPPPDIPFKPELQEDKGGLK
jgi:hypothetical protein